MKQIQWFPGHMSKALREIGERVKVVDIVIEVVDARAPISSRNPELDKLIGNKQHLILINKKDLANEQVTKNWITHFKGLGFGALAIEATRVNYNEVKQACLTLLKEKFDKEKAKGLRPRAIRALIVGIPNVGKSTLINRLAKRKAANVENRPGVTKSQQLIKIDKDFELLDTPGVLWHNFEEKEIGIKLALIGTIKQNILPKEELCFRLLKYLTNYKKGVISARYNLEEIVVETEEDSYKLLDMIGVKRGLIQKGNVVDLEATIQRVLNEFSNGILGRFSLDGEDVIWLD